MTRSESDITFVVEQDDWIDLLVEPLREETLQTIRELSLNRLQRYPLPKISGLPVGRELSVLRRYLAGRCAVFEPSALSAIYSRHGGARDRLLYRAFVLGHTLPHDTWVGILGAQALDRWREGRLLREDPAGLHLRFRVYGIGPITLIADPQGSRLLRRVVAGQDSLNLVDFLHSKRLPRMRRLLDVGPGSGVVLLSVAHLAQEAVGLDINPRAVKLTRLNAELNHLPQVQAFDSDVFQHGGRHGVFDLITWNMPYMLMPPSCRETHYDGYGGELGVQIQLDFVRLLPTLLAPGGRALLGATSTIMDSGENLLDLRLREIAGQAGLDIVARVFRSFWSMGFPQYQRECGVRRFEALRLEITRGAGRVTRFEPPVGTRALDLVRRWVHARRP